MTRVRARKLDPLCPELRPRLGRGVVPDTRGLQPRRRADLRGPAQRSRTVLSRVIRTSGLLSNALEMGHEMSEPQTGSAAGRLVTLRARSCCVRVWERDADLASRMHRTPAGSPRAVGGGYDVVKALRRCSVDRSRETRCQADRLAWMALEPPAACKREVRERGSGRAWRLAAPPVRAGGSTRRGV